MTSEQIVKIAKIIDPEAWKALEDGRNDIPGNLWEIRRTSAQSKAVQIIAELDK